MRSLRVGTMFNCNGNGVRRNLGGKYASNAGPNARTNPAIFPQMSLTLALIDEQYKTKGRGGFIILTSSLFVLFFK